ncbi:MAG TPA: glycine-rich domain-containing protein-like [Thermoanaerobaculia bacterium]|jgi:hypothetical protein
MTAHRSWSISTEQSLKAIAELDLEPIRWKLTGGRTGLGWPLRKALDAEEAYRKFLILCAKYPGETIVPTTLIDEVWHNHVLHTRKYQEDCRSIFGEMLHHDPQSAEGGDESGQIRRNIIRTIELFEEEFGILPPGLFQRDGEDESIARR